MAVQTVLENLNIDYLGIDFGKVSFPFTLSASQKSKINEGLRFYELEVIDNKKLIIVECIKSMIIQKLHSSDMNTGLKFSVELSENLHYDYTYLANIFSEIEKSTIEKFFIFSRIERVKELMIYEDLSIKEICYQMNYSSVSHLCLQFKKVTGKTPALFKKLAESGTFA